MRSSAAANLISGRFATGNCFQKKLATTFPRSWLPLRWRQLLTPTVSPSNRSRASLPRSHPVPDQRMLLAIYSLHVAIAGPQGLSIGWLLAQLPNGSVFILDRAHNHLLDEVGISFCG